MLQKPISSLKGKKIALVAMGNSQLDYHLAITHSETFDEVWVVNAMCGVVPNPDRVFLLDPPTRFFDTEDAGDMTEMMRKVLPELKCPVYTCELDDRIPSAELYPLEPVIKDAQCAYLNNTVSYAIAFAYWNRVGGLNIFGADFTYKSNLYFAEMGRGCCEFWCAKCMEKGVEVSIAGRSNLLDANIDAKDKLYGYHRLPDPIVSYQEDGKMKIIKWSEIIDTGSIPVGISGREDNPLVWLDRKNTPMLTQETNPVEPKKY